MGDVIGDINSRRGSIVELTDRNGLKQVESTVPLANMFQVRREENTKLVFFFSLFLCLVGRSLAPEEGKFCASFSCLWPPTFFFFVSRWTVALHNKRENSAEVSCAFGSRPRFEEKSEFEGGTSLLKNCGSMR